MHDEASAVHIGLTDYEAEQIALIAHWKGRRSPAIEELFNMVAGRVAQTVGKVVPDELTQKAILKLYDIADRAAGQEDICRKMGVDDLARLRDWPLDQWRPLAKKVGQGALGILRRRRSSHGRRRGDGHRAGCSPPVHLGHVDHHQDRPLLWLSPPRPWWQGASSWAS